MDCTELMSYEKSFIFPTYARYPICISHGVGNKLYDFQGKEYLDLLSGIAVCNLGHGNKEISDTIYEQAKKLIHVSNLFYTEPQIKLAKALLGTTSHLKKVFLCNSGAEANEAAIKLTRRYMKKVRDENRYEIITLFGSFHGRTYATMSATGQDKIKDGFEPLNTGFLHVNFHKLDDIKKKISKNTAAIMIELIQGEGGVRPLSKDLVQDIFKLCKDQGIILIVDEIQTGMGRTGKMWAFEHYDIKPDIITCAKALANGLPIGCMMSTDEVAKGFTLGSHATTFGGGPVVCAAALKVLEIIKRDKLIENAQNMGEFLKTQLLEIKTLYPNLIKEVRGIGLMVGIELTDEVLAQKIFNRLLEQGIILNLTQQKILRLLPPLTITHKELSEFITKFKAILDKIDNE